MKTFLISSFIIIFFSAIALATPPYRTYQQVVVPQKIVEFDATYFQGLNNYYSVGDRIRAEKQEQQTSEVDFYKGQIDMLLKIIAAQNGGKVPSPTVPAPTPEQPPNPNPPPTPTPNQPGNGDYKVTEIDKQVYNIVKTKCARCHGDTQQDGGLALIKNDTLQLVDIYDRVELYDRVAGIGLQARNKVRMPKGGNPLSDSEVETFRLWMIQEADAHR